jgi:hypothetical protein
LETERLVLGCSSVVARRGRLVLTPDRGVLHRDRRIHTRWVIATLVDQECRSWFEPVRMAHTSLFGEPASSGMKTGAMRIAGIVNGSIGGQATEPRY